MKVIIVGGVAGGASCAARLRRLNEQAEIERILRNFSVSVAAHGDLLEWSYAAVVDMDGTCVFRTALDMGD